MLGCRSTHNRVHHVKGNNPDCCSIPTSGLLRSPRGRSCRVAPAVHRPCQSERHCSTQSGRIAASAKHYSIPAPPGVKDAEEVLWRDSSTDVAFIGMCRKAYGNLAGWQSDADWQDGVESYRGMIEVSRALMKGKTAEQQRDAVIAGFPQVPAWFRCVFPATRWGAKLNARITPAFFSWLVGPMEPVDVEVDGVLQRSGVHIKRCRYLAESGCAGMCINLCKTPTQTFFTEQLGMPLTMEPDFETFECTMSFWQAAAAGPGGRGCAAAVPGRLSKRSRCGQRIGALPQAAVSNSQLGEAAP